MEGVETNIEYSSHTLGNITLNRTIELIVLLPVVSYTNIYSVRFYDDKHDESPAIELHHQLITGLLFVINTPTTCVTESDTM